MAVALHQLFWVRHADLSAWCGGGFGMFSTLDGWGNRHLHAVALGPATRASLEIPPSLRETAERALALPSEAHLRALALALAPFAPSELGAPESIRFDVFVRRHDPGTLAPYGERLRSLEVPLATGAEPR